jgi:hypothetical protein
MILALMLAAAAAPQAVPQGPQMSAIDAERAFAADAQRLGQWTAFRKWSTADSLMFVPQPTRTRDYLKGRKDPQPSVFWWPGRSYVSCDGRTAINTGPWVRGYGKSVGYFTTVWVKQPDGAWKWVYDAGDESKFMRDEGGDIAPTNATCPTAPLPPAPPREIQANVITGGGSSADGTLSWGWSVGRTGERHFFALMWDGKKRQTVVEDRVAAPK